MTSNGAQPRDISRRDIARADDADIQCFHDYSFFRERRAALPFMLDKRANPTIAIDSLTA